MGKSGKKIKSDRINTLRKQYDAFLEDDKKRKDRNEYILGRLEGMQSSVALVKTYEKGNVHIKGNLLSGRGIPDYLINPPKMENLRTLQNRTITPSDGLTKQFESSILKEISKNYILIPKLQSCLTSDLTYPHIEIDDADWKSKYNILNELKQNEKEGASAASDGVNNFVLAENDISHFATPEPESKQQKEIIDNKALTHNLNPPKYELNPINTNANRVKTDLNDRSATYYTAPNIQDESVPQSDIPNINILHKLESVKNDQYAPTINNAINKIEVSQHQLTEPNHELNTNVGIYDTELKLATHQETNLDVNKIETEITGSGDQQNYDNQIIIEDKTDHFNEDIKEEISYIEKNDTRNVPENDVINFSAGNQENPKEYVENEPELGNIENHDQTANAEINDLEKEQNEMFYAENTEENYEYNEGNEEALNPAENVNFTNDQYPYYDETQQEQPPYTAEINEYEESTERYDPNYEQQYAENYENVPQYDHQQYDNAYDTQQEPLEPTLNYEELPPTNDNFIPVSTENNVNPPYQNQEATEYTFANENYESQHYDTNEQQEYSTTDLNNQDQYAIHQDYDQINTEPETVKEMEATLDTEDGYVDNQNLPLHQNIDESITSDISSIKKESSVEVS